MYDQFCIINKTKKNANPSRGVLLQCIMQFVRSWQNMVCRQARPTWMDGGREGRQTESGLLEYFTSFLYHIYSLTIFQGCSHHIKRTQSKKHWKSEQMLFELLVRLTVTFFKACMCLRPDLSCDVLKNTQNQ